MQMTRLRIGWRDGRQGSVRHTADWSTFRRSDLVRVARRAVDKLLGVAVERAVLKELEVEVTGAAEDRADPGPPRDHGEDRDLHAVDEPGSHQ